MRVYRIDQEHGNPSALFDPARDGPYPSAAKIAAMREAAEPAARSLGAVGAGRVHVALTEASVVLVHACARHAGSGAAAATVPSHLRVNATTTAGQVFLRWTHPPSRCVATYVVEYAAAAGGAFKRINAADTILGAHVHAGTASGCFRVAAVDYWGVRSASTPAVCVHDLKPLPFSNA